MKAKDSNKQYLTLLHRTEGGLVGGPFLEYKN